MKNKQWMSVLLGLTLGGFNFAAEAQTRPNIIFLMTDDQSIHSMGCYGNGDVQTPNLDRLATDGMIFDRHYATTAICMGSRATVMTGLLEYRSGTNFMHGHMQKSTWQKSYPVLLRQAGYRTAFAGKFGFDIQEVPGTKTLPVPSHDFDVWKGGEGQTSYSTKKNESMKEYADEYPHCTLSYGAFGRDFIKESAQTGQPFCLSISFKAPHLPRNADNRFNKLYKDKIFTKPDNFGRENGLHFAKQSHKTRGYNAFEDRDYDKDYNRVIAQYYRQVYGVDVAVGMIRDALKEAGIDQNTVILYTSDNGYFCGAHGFGLKALPYEEASRVPMIIYDPRHSNSGKGLRSATLTGNVDIAPTLLDLAGCSIPEGLDGRSMLSVYEKPTATIHESLPLINVWGVSASHALTVVTKDHKYINWSYAGENYEVTEELYDLNRDSLELVNMAQHPEAKETLKKMQKLYDGHVAHWGQQAVDYNSYQQFGMLFDRTKTWAEKEPFVVELDRASHQSVK
ncbi:sulfatase family protein [Pontiella sulfatireligans]|uniref:Arylsulfatase n=1 Tax=Pontiella sulfatireligans TaxID=2750658 RepID=A0A6C2UEJ4_9BACT|nr:sulfatase [Pontiella sulfatireligans]SPS74143.1 sulfatase S1_25 [Kiritimatiellales bacterium]VGO18293.1 Arylsulfatase [Pontiella sulfatireligans]